MKVALVAAEAVPYAKVGGLADVVGTLPRYLNKEGVEVKVFIPRYKGIKGRYHTTIRVNNKSVKIYYAGNYYFVNHPFYYQRAGIYGEKKGDYNDNCERFSFFCRAVSKLVLGGGYDIVHCNDWHTGLLPLYLRQAGANIKTVFTIHNLGYQGIFPVDKIDALGLDIRKYKSILHHNKINFLKAGIIYSDIITTVSENYAWEIQSEKFGFGLNEILTSRRSRLYGIINGIDYQEWNPEKDKFIYRKFRGLKGKHANKNYLCKKSGLEKKRPLIGMVSRITGQKGFDILLESMQGIIKLGCNLILVGMGDKNYCSELKRYCRLFPSRISVNLKFDNRLAHQIYAGSDFFLMPSYYEPCGLGQMIALKYLSIPVVRKTGGLADTVHQYNPMSGSGNGFLFKKYSSRALLNCLNRALRVYQNPKKFINVIQNAMKADFSWSKSAQKYKALYNMVLKNS